MQNRNMIGVLGGLGPWATEEFLRMVFEETVANCDQDYPDLLVMNRSTTPDRTAHILGKCPDSPGPAMARDAKILENAGCSAIVIPCNTSHVYYEEATRDLHIPALHLIREVVAEGKKRGMKCLGILGTEGTRRSNLYGIAAEEMDVEYRILSEEKQARITHLIYGCMKAGRPPEREDLTAAFDELIAAGCDGLILGCTELPIAYRALGLEEEYPMALDSLRILARRTVEESGCQLKGNSNV